MVKREKILISGRVQGVGFRPAVYNIADKLGLCGFIYNDTKGVTIELQGEAEKISDFKARLRGRDKPPLAEIKTLESMEIAVVDGEQGFVIRTSKSEGTALSQVTADMAVCEDCLSEMQDKGDF
ncbi:MAG: acylphosphatase, partial [Planctomycetota bacterium]